MAKLIFKHDIPKIEYYENFLSSEECDEIISLSQENLKESKVTSAENGESILQPEHRKCKNTALDRNQYSIVQEIEKRISDAIKIDSNRFEQLTVISYKPGDYFKPHYDFFHGKTSSYTNQGGNRMATVILYLNDVDDGGGETRFPHLGITVSCKKGSMLCFFYDYLNSNVKNKTFHEGIPTISSDKWISTTWVRQGEIGKPFIPRHAIEKFKVTCGPENDLKTIEISLPENDDQNNTILVAFSGGIDSTLLLYLIARENLKQDIPYIIQPLCITSYYGAAPGQDIWEDWHRHPKIINFIRHKLGVPYINEVAYFAGPPDAKSKREQLREGYKNYWKLNPNSRLLFVGNLDKPPEFAEGHNEIVIKVPENIKLPFLKINKSHIVDAMIKLGLEELINLTPKCVVPHKDHLEDCDKFFCRERRWAYHVLNRPDLYEKFLRGD